MTHRYLMIIVIAIFMMFVDNSNIIAQPSNPDANNNTQHNKQGAKGPIDNSIVWILVLGSLYGVYKAREKYKIKSISE